MTGIEKIVNTINENAEREARQIIEEARSQADIILANALSEVRSQSATVIAETKSECGEIERRAVSMAGLEVRKMRLEIKQKMIGQAFDSALKQMSEMPANDYIKFLALSAINTAEDGAELIFSAADREAYGKAITDAVNRALSDRGIKVTLSDETRNIPGGLIIRNGRVEINCALDTLIAYKREELSAEAAKLLF